MQIYDNHITLLVENILSSTKKKKTQPKFTFIAFKLHLPKYILITIILYS